MSKYFNENEQSQSSSVNNKLLADKNIFEKIEVYSNIIKDKLLIYQIERWIFVLFLTMIYIVRIIQTGGFHCLTYCICVHFLNSFIGFISPLEDPEEASLNNDDSFLPQKNNEEFKPFQRKVKEYTFWSVMATTLFFAIFLTFFKVFDIPVFWPLLLIYFVVIFCLVMRRQIQHMIKYHYLPWDAGKMKYGK